MSGAVGAPRRWLFAATILTGSFLLFLVQPMVARMALPRLGGAPNVWNSAMLVYQALLLGGYAYAHAISRWPIRRQAAVHLALLVAAALTLPIAMPELAPFPPGQEAFRVPWLFVLTVGPLFFVVSAQAPLMQRWFAAHPQAGDPYPLYAASNLGSFAGLLAYPLVAEPLLPLTAQSGAWAAGYGLLIGLVALTALARRGAGRSAVAPAAVSPAPPPGWRRIGLWLALSAVPSGLMLSTTTHLTTDIFAAPMLWVIPLGLYLLSFSIAFAARSGFAAVVAMLAPIVLCIDGAVAMMAAERPGLLTAAASLVLLFVVAVALHFRLYETRPEPARLTQFYLVIAAGGVLGGLFTALVAPLVFDWTWEHPLLILAAAGLVPLRHGSQWLARILPNTARRQALLAFLLLVVAVGASLLRSGPRFEAWGGVDLLIFVVLFVAVVFVTTARWVYVPACALLLAAAGGVDQARLTLEDVRSRSYFGIYTVNDLPEGPRQLLHGTTLHGIQHRVNGVPSLAPTTYYGPDSGAGLALQSADRLFGPQARVGIVGLGVGTLACYRRPGQSWTFYEIDPEILEYSQQGVFTFVRECAPDASIVIGDARLKLAEAAPGSFDLLLIDAFSSDAIPLHLLTEEALDVYFRALGPEGILVMHISNRFIDLEPVIAAIAEHQGYAAAVRRDRTRQGSLSTSDWVALARSPDRLAQLTGESGWNDLRPATRSPWRDDYASILPHIRWSSLF